MDKHRSEDFNPGFKWHHYQGEIIVLCVRWYLRYRLSYRDLEEMMAERGLTLDHTTIYRWVQYYGKEIHKRITKYLRSPNDSWRIDEIYVKIKETWHGPQNHSSTSWPRFVIDNDNLYPSQHQIKKESTSRSSPQSLVPVTK